MKTELWHQANRIFEQALDVPQSQLNDWLDRACEGRRDLREEVERRLAADAEAEAAEFLDQPLATPPRLSRSTQTLKGSETPETEKTTAITGPRHPASEDNHLPDRLGPYRLLHEIGRGGMGTVYAAERSDGSFVQSVAIKVITAGTENEEVRRRLLTERQILASLVHPNIARIYDGGSTPDGRPYFAMERISGTPIDQHCAENQLSVQQRLALIREVCGAVSYAHRNLVVHRDIKPSNILVTAEGQVKLLDFGIAKVLESDAAPNPGEEATRPWRQRLTLHYASPEQLRGIPVTTASDVYALGVLTFQLLTGSLPRSFDRLSPWEAVRSFLTSEAPPLSRSIDADTATEQFPVANLGELRKQLSGDLDAIVGKALRTEAQARYRSADQFADDLEHFQRGFPVKARQGTLRYRATRLIQRHRWAAASTGLAALLALAFLTTTWLSKHRLEAKQEQLVAEQAKQRATSSMLFGILDEAGIYISEGVTVTVREAVDRRAALIEETPSDQPTVFASLLSTLGWVYLSFGELDRSLDYHQQALEIRRTIDAGAPGTLDLSGLSGLSERIGSAKLEARADLADSLDGVAAALVEQWRLKSAKEYSSAALGIHRSQPNPNPLTLLRSLNTRTKLFCNSDDWQAADPVSAEAEALARSLFDSDSPEPTKALPQRARVLSALGRDDEALEIYEETVTWLVAKHGPTHPILAPIYSNQGSIEHRRGKTREAIESWNHAEALYAAGYGDLFYDRVFPLFHLGEAHQSLNNLAEAEAYFRQAIDVARRSPALGINNEIGYLAPSAVALGHLLADADRCEEAIELLQDKVTEWEARRGKPKSVVVEGRAVLTRCQEANAATSR